MKLILLTIACFLLGYLSTKVYTQNLVIKAQTSQVEKLEAKSDSLQAEMFNLQTINGRYELSLEHLKEINPKAAKQFEDYLNNQTE